MRLNKGQFEYASYKKKSEFLKTIIAFAIPLSLFIMGYYTTHTKANLLTIVAVLGLLPASKMLVSALMNARVKCADSDTRLKIDSSIGELAGLYNMYFTSYESNFYICHMIVTKDSIIGYTTDSKFEEDKFKKHLEKHLKLDGITGINIKIFTALDTYTRRLAELNKSESRNVNDSIVNLLMSISL